VTIPSVAGPACGPAALLVGQLAIKYHEQMVGRAVYQDSGAWRFLYVGPSMLPDVPATFSIVDLYPGGMACLVASGRGVPAWVTNIISGRSET
jgi:hypothetical protein